MNSHEKMGIPSAAAIGRHPIHPMLVPLPIGFFIISFVLDVAFWVTRSPSLATITAWVVVAGFATGALAAVAGLIDFLAAAQIRRLYHAWYHLAGNTTVLVLSLASVVLRFGVGPEAAVLPWGLLLSAAIVGLLVFTGWHGGEMVYGHGVGMEQHEHGHEKNGAT